MNAKEVQALALSFLARRDKSRRQVEDHLQRKGAPPALLAETINTLIALTYLDDVRLARSAFREGASKGRSTQEVIQRLSRLGVSAEDVAKSLAEEGFDERAAAMRFVERKKLHGLKAGQALLRKGFDEQVIFELGFESTDA
jgi:regulatory protein